MNTIRKNPQVDKKVSDEQYHLEMQLHKQSSYKLTREDVKKVLLKENIIKYKQFEYSAYQVIVGKFLTCLRRTLSKRK